ncbi:hypothetical protein D6745_05505 [Candidatus Woesearchaeota archaeon]|nr:MAG: hypothetical protein D6745_05505 [Candidatus Woesearchaeota archaeon]
MVEDVNKIIQKNRLAKELKRHGIADDSAQAFSQANEIIGGEKIGLTEKNTEKLQNNDRNIIADINSLQRFRESAHARMNELSEQISGIKSQLKEVLDLMSKLEKSNSPKQKISEEPKKSAPIDRNNVSPDDVQIDKIFYYGQK